MIIPCYRKSLQILISSRLTKDTSARIIESTVEIKYSARRTPLRTDEGGYLVSTTTVNHRASVDLLSEIGSHTQPFHNLGSMSTLAVQDSRQRGMTSKAQGLYSAAYAYNYHDKLTGVTSNFPNEGNVTYGKWGTVTCFFGSEQFMSKVERAMWRPVRALSVGRVMKVRR